MYQLQTLTVFSAVIDRLSEFDDLLTSIETEKNSNEVIVHEFGNVNNSDDIPSTLLLSIQYLTLLTPRNVTLIRACRWRSLRRIIFWFVFIFRFLRYLFIEIIKPEQISGPSGSGKTSLLRGVAGLSSFGSGTIRPYQRKTRDLFFLPQKPYMVLGTLGQQVAIETLSRFFRQQLLHPWIDESKLLPREKRSGFSIGLVRLDSSRLHFTMARKTRCNYYCNG
ncbi:hypothetical protein CASFOL_012988 [Castilleja foliolosa]|uniref:ABC transporter domain-containing protein n=1 Tax=Castilleja foliolosa TaxID=1961234 RepID=A0ABD3DIT0_9LAMI